ncbi:MAG: GldG family protein [Spirochaetales bacterium]|nr:GldG family protein [Spirochaetales bacterium]
MEEKKNIFLQILTGKWVRFVLYIVVAILVNLAGLAVFFRIDLTESRMYTLSEASIKTLQALKQPLTFQIFFTENLPAPYNTLEQYLKDLLEEYSLHTERRFFNYQFNNVNSEEGKLSEEAIKNQELARSYGIAQENVQVVKDDEVKFQMAYMGMAVIYGDMSETITLTNFQSGLEYKLTSTINKLISKNTALLDLPEKIKVTIYLSTELYPAAENLDTIPAKMKEIVDNLNKKNYDKFELQVIDPSNNPAAAAEADKLNVIAFREQESPNQSGPVKKYYAGLVISYKDKHENFPIVDYGPVITSRGLEMKIQPVEMGNMEDTISGTVENLIDINMNIGIVTSNDTLPLTKDRNQVNFNPYSPRPETNLYRLLKEVYTVKQIDLKKDEIPSDIQCLVIAGPKESFSDWELFKIDQFLMKGKSLAVFLDGIQETTPDVDPQMQQLYYGGQIPKEYVPLTTGLEKLLGSYGVTVDQGYLYDESCYVDNSKQGGSQKVYFAPKIEPATINHNINFMKNINELLLVTLSPLTIDSALLEQNKLSNKVLFSSSKDSWVVKKDISMDARSIQPPMLSEDKKSFPIAALVEGDFPSYFAGKEAPSKPVDNSSEGGEQNQAGKTSAFEVKEPVIEKGAYGRLLLMGSGQMLRDDYTFNENFTQNLYMVINAIDYLNGRADYAVMRTKTQEVMPLNSTKPEEKNFVKILNIGGVPALVIIMGILIFLRRRARRSIIQKKFEKTNPANS